MDKRIESAITHMRSNIKVFKMLAKSNVTEFGNERLKSAENMEYAISILESHPFKLTDAHEALIPPFTFGIVFTENGEEKSMDFEIPFSEIKGIFNQVVDNLSEV